MGYSLWKWGRKVIFLEQESTLTRFLPYIDMFVCPLTRVDPKNLVLLPNSFPVWKITCKKLPSSNFLLCINVEGSRFQWLVWIGICSFFDGDFWCRDVYFKLGRGWMNGPLYVLALIELCWARTGSIKPK